jgi:hypothetical protein
MQTAQSRSSGERGRRKSALLAGVCLVLLAGCHSLKLTPQKDEHEPALAAPGQHSVRVSQFLFLADFKLREDLPLFQELSAMRDQIQKDLKLPSSSSVIQVYLFEDKERYESYMHAKYPQLPARRAFFVGPNRSAFGHGNGNDLLVYTYWGDRIQQDLRHELTHALLHSVLMTVPMWLDEGLAEYYELPPRHRGVNAAHVAKMRHGVDGPARLNLARLELLTDDDVEKMHPAEYQESWAWVHLMLHSTPEAKAALLQYLQYLRNTPAPKPLLPSLAEVFPKPEDALEKHLAKLDEEPITEAQRIKR